MTKKLPTHISFIMDGNGRWAQLKNKPRTFGHQKGLKTIKKITKKIYDLEIKNISFYAFSIDNFKRPIEEVNFIMNGIKKYFDEKYINDLVKHSVKFMWVGFEDNLDVEIIEIFRKIEKQTIACKKLTIYFFFNYSFSRELQEYFKTGKMLTCNIPQIDLLIRTSGEKRISNYCMNLLLYSEIIFEEIMWPAYSIAIFNKNLKEFFKRERRFGNVRKN